MNESIQAGLLALRQDSEALLLVESEEERSRVLEECRVSGDPLTADQGNRLRTFDECQLGKLMGFTISTLLIADQDGLLRWFTRYLNPRAKEVRLLDVAEMPQVAPVHREPAKKAPAGKSARA
jgi:hypothetical protein